MNMGTGKFDFVPLRLKPKVKELKWEKALPRAKVDLRTYTRHLTTQLGTKPLVIFRRNFYREASFRRDPSNGQSSDLSSDLSSDHKKEEEPLGTKLGKTILKMSH